MFQNQKPQPAKKARKGAASVDTAVTILTAGCHFDGKLYTRGSSRIGGRIDGEIVSEGLLIIEEEAVITASVQADEAIIQGTVKGRIEATGRVELCPTSHFEGDIVTPSLVIREGAKFNGSARMVDEAGADISAQADSDADDDKLKDAVPIAGKNADLAVMKTPEVGVPGN